MGEDFIPDRDFRDVVVTVVVDRVRDLLFFVSFLIDLIHCARVMLPAGSLFSCSISLRKLALLGSAISVVNGTIVSYYLCAICAYDPMAFAK